MSFYLYTGILTGIYTLYAGLQYYSLSGEGLVDAENVSKMKFDHIIDVRTKIEWDIGHHKDAIHIPVNNLTKKELKAKKIKISDKILVYCNTGQRARRAAEIIRSFGYKDVFYIKNSWKSIK